VRRGKAHRDRPALAIVGVIEPAAVRQTARHEAFTRIASEAPAMGRTVDLVDDRHDPAERAVLDAGPLARMIDARQQGSPPVEPGDDALATAELLALDQAAGQVVTPVLDQATGGLDALDPAPGVVTVTPPAGLGGPLLDQAAEV